MVGVAINTFPVYMCARQTILCETMNEEENKYNIHVFHINWDMFYLEI